MINYPESYAPLEISAGGLVKARNSGLFSSSTHLRVTVTVTEGDAARRLQFEVVYYPAVYVNEVMDNYLKTEIADSMTDMEKVEQIAEICVRDFDYDTGVSSWDGLILYGGGDCWAFANFVTEACARLGLPTGIRRGLESGVPDANHRNALVEVDGQLYIVDASYPGNKPRHYTIDKTGDYGFGVTNGVNTPSGIKLYQFERWYMFAYKPEPTYRIPDTINDLPVIALHSSFLPCLRWVRQIVFPSTLETIGDYALCYADDLEILSLPDGLISIGEGAFLGASKLQRVEIPASVTSIGADAFANCPLVTIVAPEGS